ncbi:hypothetical protein EBR96_05325 [bacterium]|nr:hypothetical protein [bacterium]
MRFDFGSKREVSLGKLFFLRCTLKRKILIWLLGLVMMAIPTIAADSPVLYLEGVFSDQGTNGGFVKGIRNVQVSIVTSANLSVRVAGTELWTETIPNYPFTDGQLYVELGRINPIPPEIFLRPNLSFVVSISGVDGQVSIPMVYNPLAVRANVADKAMSVSSNAIIGVIGDSNIQGAYTGITGLGTLTTTLNVSNDLKVGNSVVFAKADTRKVGIGVSDPAYPLDVDGSLRIRRGALVFPDGSEMTTAVRELQFAKGLTNSGNLTMDADAGAIGTGSAVIRVGKVERVTILNNGLVGIGVTAPTFGFMTAILKDSTAQRGPGWTSPAIRTGRGGLIILPRLLVQTAMTRKSGLEHRRRFINCMLKGRPSRMCF